MKKTKIKNNSQLNILILLTLINLFGLIFLGILTKQNRDSLAAKDIGFFVESALKSNLLNPARDTQSGDLYFPEMRLNIKNTETTPILMYRYLYMGENKELNITSSGVLKTERMFSAASPDKAIEEIPILQSCARGVAVSYSQYSETDYPSTEYDKSEKTLVNGKKLYFRSEKKCSDIASLMDTIKTIEAY